MKKFFNKPTQPLWSFVAFGTIIGIAILCGNTYFPKISWLQILSQGEVITGIVIAPPTLYMWYYSIKTQKEDEKRENILDLLKVVRDHDQQLYEIADEIQVTRTFKVQDVYKIKHTIDSFKKFEKSNQKALEEQDLSLDYKSILFSITSVEKPKDDSINIDAWNAAISEVQTTIIREILSNKQSEILGTPHQKFFYHINLDEMLSQDDVVFRNATFYECTFPSKIIETPSIGKKQFKECNFQNCNFEVSIEQVKHLEENLRLFTMVDDVMVDISEDTNDSTAEVLFSTGIFDETTFENRVYDLRNTRQSSKTINQYLVEKKFFKIKINDNDEKPMNQQILEKLKNILPNNKDMKENNCRFSISKNYDDRKTDVQWSGWHSIMREKVEKANNFKYYIFVVRKDDDGYVIVFTTEMFKRYLNELNRNTGKYDFYFSGNDATVK